MKVSVVMAGRNSNPSMLKEAIDSILNQTFQDFEFIFVDDGSDKPMEPVVRSISSDPRISVFRIDHSGLGAALNHGIENAKGVYIARIDDDDIALPTRLEKQVIFLDEHPGVSCVGTQMYYKYGKKLYPHPVFPEDHLGIVSSLINLHFSIGHTVSMYRKKCFKEIGGYRIPGGGQDLDLFLQLGTVGNLANLHEYLGCYSLSPSGLSVVNPKKNEAYVFALEEALKYEGYSAYINNIRDSINNLNNKTKIGISTSFRKIILIYVTKCFGKNIDEIL